MGVGTIRPNQRFRWKDRLFQINLQLTDGTWHLTELATGLTDVQPAQVLWAAYERSDLHFVDPNDTGATTELWVAQTFGAAAVIGPAASSAPGAKDEGQAAAHRYEYVRAIVGQPASRHPSVITRVWEQECWPQKKPGTSTVYEWRLRAKGASDPIAALRARHALKGNRSHRYDEEIKELVREVRDKHYLKSKSTLTVEAALSIIKNKIALLNKLRTDDSHLPVPKRAAFRSILDEVPLREQLAKRHGADYAYRVMRYSAGGVRPKRLLERVELDHTTLAVYLLDDDFNPWGRASTTVALEVRSRSVLGTYWGAEVPSTVSIARCIRQSVQPKVEFLTRFPDVCSEWPCFGVAEIYAMDNGMEEHASAFRQALSELGGSVPEWSRRATPWHKPHIERYFRRQDLDLLQTLPAATMENILKRPDFNPKVDLALRKSTYDRIYAKWLVDIYQNEPQAALGNLSPNAVWRSEIASIDQFVPTRSVLLERLFYRTVQNRRLDHEGVEFDCLIYSCAELGALRSQLGPVLAVTIRVSDEELGYIFVNVPNADVWIRAPCTDRAYADGLTRWQHDKCKKARSIARKRGGDVALAEAHEYILEQINEERKQLGSKRRKIRARFVERVRPTEDLDQHKAFMPNKALEQESSNLASGLDVSTIPEFAIFNALEQKK